MSLHGSCLLPVFPTLAQGLFFLAPPRTLFFQFLVAQCSWPPTGFGSRPYSSSPRSRTSFPSRLKCHYSNLIPLLPLSRSSLPINTPHIPFKVLTDGDYVTLPLLAVNPVRQGLRFGEITVIVPDSALSRCSRNSARCLIAMVR